MRDTLQVNMLFILLLIGASILLIALTHISLLILSATKWKRQADIYVRHEKVTSDSEEDNSSHNNGVGATADLSALINAIKAEGRTNRAEEKREEYADNFREWVTTVLVALTLIAVGWQVNEMIKVYGPIRDQGEAARIMASSARPNLEISDREGAALSVVKGPNMRVDIANTGVSTATEVSVNASIISLDSYVSKAIDYHSIQCGQPKSVSFNNESKAILGRRDEWLGFQVDLHGTKIKYFAPRYQSPYIVGCIQYRWIFSGEDEFFHTYFIVPVAIVNTATGKPLFRMGTIQQEYMPGFDDSVIVITAAGQHVTYLHVD